METINKNSNRNTFNLFFLFIFGGLFTLSACNPKIKAIENTTSKEYDLYLLVGQSNMAGRGIIENIDTTTHKRVFSLAATDQMILAKEPLHYDKLNRGTGPGFEFGKAMAAAFPYKKIGLIPAAVGGTKISYWNPGNSRGLFDEAIRKVEVAKKYGKIKGIIWQQGESDSNHLDAPLYKERLIELLNAFRNELHDRDLPIVIGGLGDFLKSPSYKEVNDALLEVSNQLEFVNFSPASKLGHIGDRLHFSSVSQRVNGRNMAKAMIDILNKQ